MFSEATLVSQRSDVMARNLAIISANNYYPGTAAIFFAEGLADWEHVVWSPQSIVSGLLALAPNR